MRCFNPFIQSILEETEQPLSKNSVCTLLFDYLDLVHPCSANESLYNAPIVHHGQVLALRILSGLGDILFSHLKEFIRTYTRPYLSKGDYIQFMEYITRNKALDIALLIDFYKRLYDTIQTLEVNPCGISKCSLLLAMSSFFPVNSSIARIVFEELQKEEEETGVSLRTLTKYFTLVFTVINEVCKNEMREECNI